MARSLFCVAALTLSSIALHSQNKDDQLRTALIQSLDRLRLGAPNAAWHLTASVQLLQNGKAADTGTIEILRTADGASRTIYAFQGFHQTVTSTLQARFIEGDAGEGPPGIREFLHFLETPTNKATINTAKLKTFAHEGNGIKLQCVQSIEAMPKRGLFCTAAGSPVIRYASISSVQAIYQTLFERVTTFEGGDVPESAVIFFDSMPIARLTLSFAPLTADDTALAIPSANAVRVSDSTSRITSHELDSQFTDPSRLRLASSSVGVSFPTSSLLLRIEVNPDGKIASVHTMAAYDSRYANHFAKSLVGRQYTGTHSTSANTFINYTFVRHVPDSIPDSNFAPSANPGYIPSRPISDY